MPQIEENTAISRPRPLDLIPGYRLDKLVGKGGMGEVFRANQLSLDRPVAVKLLSPELAKDPTFVARFEKEAAALAQLSHPNIVTIVEKGKTAPGDRPATYYLVMEYVDGPSLREVMRQPSLGAQTAVRMVLEICRAIDYAHGRGVIHRDLKPENILFDDQAGHIPKVSDFGLAAFTDDPSRKFNFTETHVSMGTLTYMAPEQRRDAKSADHRADIYSLGVILYELLVGEVPVGNYDPPSLKKPALDKRHDAVVARCLKPLPEDRYQSLGELISDLMPLGPVSFTEIRAPESQVERVLMTARRLLRHAARIASMVVVALACVVLAVSYWRQKNVIRPEPNQALAAQALEFKNTLNLPGRTDQEMSGKRVEIGEGPDQVMVSAFGRTAAAKGAVLSFQASDRSTPAGYLTPALELDGQSLRISARVQATPPDTRFRAWLKSIFSTGAVQPRAAVMLLGPSGQMVALVAPGDGGSLTFEWALGERRGAMLGPAVAPGKPLVLTLEVNAEGVLRAGHGTGADERFVGEPISLGKNWKRLFADKLPRTALGCLEGACEFARIEVEAGHPPPTVVELVTVPKTTQLTKVAPAKQTTARKVAKPTTVRRRR